MALCLKNCDAVVNFLRHLCMAEYYVHLEEIQPILNGVPLNFGQVDDHLCA